MLFFLGMTAVSLFGCTQLTLGLNQEITAITDSDLFHFFQASTKYEESGAIAYVVLQNVNYSDPVDLGVLTNLTASLSAMNDTVDPPVYSWVGPFQQFINPYASWYRGIKLVDEVGPLIAIRLIFKIMTSKSSYSYS
jgi:Niemann-Pick C1 protein